MDDRNVRSVALLAIAVIVAGAVATDSQLIQFYPVSSAGGNGIAYTFNAPVFLNSSDEIGLLYGNGLAVNSANQLYVNICANSSEGYSFLSKDSDLVRMVSFAGAEATIATTSIPVTVTTSATTTIPKTDIPVNDILSQPNQTILNGLLDGESDVIVSSLYSTISPSGIEADPRLNYSRFSMLMSEFEQLKFLDVKTVSAQIQYGTLMANGRYEVPGDSDYYLVVDNLTGDITAYNYTVVKASSSPCISVNLDSIAYCTNSTSPLEIPVPVVNGGFGETGSGYYPLNITFSASLIRGNSATFNFSVVDISNKTQLLPDDVVSGNGVYQRFSYRIPISQEVEISFGSSGDPNYSAVHDDPLTFPSNIAYAIPVNIINGQGVGSMADFQQLIPINALEICNSILCSPHLNNTEYFYYNGTLINSWYESANGILANFGSANQFSGSENVSSWVLIKPANFIPASGQNTIYLGFASNSMNIFNTMVTGEAPQLTFNYGKYDNGNSVFNVYCGFEGTSLCDSLTYNMMGSSSVTVDNGLNLDSNDQDSAAAILTSSVQAYPQITDEFSFNAMVSDAGGVVLNLGEATSPALSNWNLGYAQMYPGYEITYFDSSYMLGASPDSGNPDFLGTLNLLFADNSTMEMLWSDGVENAVTPAGLISATDTSVPISDYYPYLSVGSAGESGMMLNAAWFLTRTVPPNYVMPSVTIGNVIPNTNSTTTTSTTSSTTTSTTSTTTTTTTTTTTIPPTSQCIVLVNTVNRIPGNVIIDSATPNIIVTNSTNTISLTWNAPESENFVSSNILNLSVSNVVASGSRGISNIVSIECGTLSSGTLTIVNGIVTGTSCT